MHWAHLPLDRRQVVEARTFKWRILRTLSNYAFVLVIIAQLLDWYQWFWLDESVMDDPIARVEWLQRRHLYDRIGMVSLILFLVLRITYWVIEYIRDRQMIASYEGDE
jgi:hypothetical protein